ncbi:MAG: acyl-CoA dehydrogenase [Desulfobacterales bacterium]|jgi:alkylation response protein AidB-like acyl-CoA dehydrogenase
MAQQIADRRDVDFLLHEVLRVEEMSRHEKFEDFNRKTIDLIIAEARHLALKEILPTQVIGDRQGVHFENGAVTLPEEFKQLYETYREGEWVAMTESLEWGGQGMPRTVALAASEYFIGANLAFMMYPGLTHGAGKLIETFGTPKQKELFLKKLYTGQWCGTMLLTEPEAGSDVGALTTTARRNDDGTYSITGNKIFISGGEHDLVENIIHPVLARIEGAPQGTGGISLFVVPKIWVNDDGTLGEFNDVVCTGVEEKLGIHGNATCSMALGGKGRCRGTLLGQENKGMRAMFLMMNEARLLVGMQGFCCASSAYLNALQYARQRIQGKHLLRMRDDSAPAVPIIEHPDVRRQLLTMKAYVDGMRSLLYFVGMLDDRKDTTENAEEKARWQGLIDLLIPVAKGYVTDRSFEMCSQGLQVYGGYGYIREYPMEQLLRDCRITMIYEGTNGIQAMDLLGRKLGLNQGKPIMDLLGEIQQTLARAKGVERLEGLADRVAKAVNRLGETALHLGQTAMSPKVLNAFAFAHPFMDVCGDVILAWLHLWRAAVAVAALEKGAKKKDAAFYEGQVKSAEFFIHTILPVTHGKMKAILETNGAAIEIADEAFGG